MPRKYVHKTRGKTMNYGEESLKEAVNAVNSGLMSVRMAAKKFGIPKSTIGDKISGKTDLSRKPGRQQYVPMEIENKIVETVKTAARQGMGLTRKQLLTRTGTLCRRMQISTFKNKIPGKDWWEGVKKRHPDVSIRKPEKLGTSRARMLNSTITTKYFKDLGEIIEQLSLKDKPDSIWNCDETGKSFQHDPVRVIAEKGSRNVVGKVSDTRTNITVMACVNAAGARMPPMMIVKGKTSASLYGFNTEEAPLGTIWSYQTNGWMNDQLGESWFRDVFLKNCGPQRPQLLILDGHSSHETVGIIQIAMEENIHLLSLPPHTTHALQPLDRSVFGPFNLKYNQECSSFLNENSVNLVNKWTFPKLFRLAWEGGVTAENIQNGFKACGIFPFDPSVVSNTAFCPSDPTDVPMLSDKTRCDTIQCSLSNVISSSSSLSLSSNLPTITPATVSTIPTDIVLPFSPSPTEHLSETTPVPDDPELLLQLINNGELNITTADENGVATFTKTTSNTEPLTESVNSDNINTESLWNKAIEDIFLPPKLSKKSPTSSSVHTKRNTSHRLLTSTEILAEKIDIKQKRELKEKAKEERSKKLKIKKELAK